MNFCSCGRRLGAGIRVAYLGNLDGEGYDVGEDAGGLVG